MSTTPCRACAGTGCDRCHGTGREHLWFVTLAGHRDARQHLSIAYGPAGTPRPVVDQARIGDGEGDDLAVLLGQVPGIVLRDRRT